MNNSKKVVKTKFVGGNIKLGNMGTFSKLMGNEEIFIEAMNQVIKGSCGRHCVGCSKACYVRKSYRYPSVKLNHARNTLAFRNDIKKAFEELDLQMTRKRTPFKFIRINQSGEIETYQEFCLWIDLSKKHPETKFYIYTKNYDVVLDFYKTFGEFPSNFTINISIWHESGIEAYKTLKDSPSIKAFVYIDGFDYKSYGIEVNTYCKAYNEDGKLNKKVTCDNCQKCIKQTDDTKIVGCYDHS